ncbi:MAG: Cold shock protein CspB [bacterium ADurb.Bin243]|nr:MAG: Cold shock protein CspB [bacterium ADurb.Bin243]
MPKNSRSAKLKKRFAMAKNKNNDRASELLEKAMDKLFSKKSESALKDLREAYLIDKHNPKVVSALALCYMMIGDRQKAIEMYKKSIELMPDDTRLYYYLGRLYIEENKQVEAMSILSTGIYKCKEKLKARPEVDTFIDLAKIYAFQSQHEESVLTLFKALKMDEGNFEIYRMLSEEYFNLALYRESIVEAEKAIKLNGGDSESFLYAGLSFHKLNVMSKALEYFSKSLALNPAQPELKSLHDKIIELKSQNGPTVEEIIYFSKQSERYRGTVKWFNDENGIGYITRHDDGSEIFVHYLAVNKDGYQSLYEGEEVEFSIDTAPTGKIAVKVDSLPSAVSKVKTGKVKWFDEDRGVGEIAIEGQEAVLVHYTAITRSGVKTLAPGDFVRCEIFETENGPQAFNVTQAADGSETLLIENKGDGKYCGKIKWLDKNKNIGIIEEEGGKFQAIFKPSETLDGGAGAKTVKVGARIKFNVVDVEALESENVKKAVNIEVINND